MLKVNQLIGFGKGAAAGSVTYGTLNPSDKGANITLSNGNLTATRDAGNEWRTVRSQTHHSTGKWYWEWLIGEKGANNGIAGFCNSSAPLSGFNDFCGRDANGIAIVTNGQYVANFSFTNLLGVTMTNGNIACLALDSDNDKVWFRYQNGNWNGSATADPATNTEGLTLDALLSTTFEVYAAISVVQGGDYSTANFGATAFTYTMPSGFSAWG